MKKALILLAILAIGMPLFAQALTFRFGENYSLKKDEQVVGDMYIAGGNTAVSGKISGDLHIAGGNVVVSGLIGEDAVIAGGDIKILPQTIISKDAAFAGGKIVIDGFIAGDLKIAGGEVQINDGVSGDVYITADKIIIGDSANIVGDLSYASSRPAIITEGARIGGEITYSEITIRPTAEKFLPTLWGTWIFIKLIMLLVAALLLHSIFKNISVKFVSTTLGSFWRSLLRGFLVLVAMPIAVVLLLMTFIGVPFVILGIATWIILVTLAWAYGAITVGSLVRRLIKKDKLTVVTWKTIFVGIVVVFLLGYVPYVGLPIKTVLMVASLGAIWHVFYEKFVQVR